MQRLHRQIQRLGVDDVGIAGDIGEVLPQVDVDRDTNANAGCPGGNGGAIGGNGRLIQRRGDDFHVFRVRNGLTRYLPGFQCGIVDIRLGQANIGADRNRAGRRHGARAGAGAIGRKRLIANAVGHIIARSTAAAWRGNGCRGQGAAGVAENADAVQPGHVGIIDMGNGIAANIGQRHRQTSPARGRRRAGDGRGHQGLISGDGCGAGGGIQHRIAGDRHFGGVVIDHRHISGIGRRVAGAAQIGRCRRIQHRPHNAGHGGGGNRHIRRRRQA